MNTLIASTNLALFIPAALALLLTPGPVVLYVVTRSIDQGRSAGLVSALSAALGDFCHVMVAAFGLSALLLSSALAFDLVKYLGAAYLIYLGIRKLLAKDEPVSLDEPPQRSSRRIFSQGLLVSVLNPKTALFFLAFLPQFVDKTSGSITLQILFLGVIFVLMGAITNSCYALLSGTARRWLRGSLRFLRIQRYVAGTIYIGLGVTAALAGSGSKK